MLCTPKLRQLQPRPFSKAVMNTLLDVAELALRIPSLRCHVIQFAL